jgi:hypothetical protein
MPPFNVKSYHPPPFEFKHQAFLYDNEQQRDDAITKFINEGLDRGQLCIYGTIHLTDKEYFKTMSSRITDYEENVKKGNLIVIDFLPFYIAALKKDLIPYKGMQKAIEEKLGDKKDARVRIVGDATGYLFKNDRFDECIMVESWWQGARMPAVSTLCLFEKSLMNEIPFKQHRNRVAHNHDILLNL